MALFIYDTNTRTQLTGDLFLVSKHCRELVATPVQTVHFLKTVRMMTHHDLIVLPSSVSHHTELLERLKTIARAAGIRVQPLPAYVEYSKNTVLREARRKRSTTPAAACAVPPTQHPVAAGKPTHLDQLINA